VTRSPTQTAVPGASTGRHDTVPKVFGRYLLLRRLSRGGMGEIFLAKSGQLTGFEKLCVIKKVLPNLAADSEFIKRFIDEAQVAIKLSHANIAPVFEVGMADGEYFLALEYIEGRDCRRLLTRLGEKRRRLPVDLGLLCVREVANGLAYAHRRTDGDGKPLGVVHCDVSPPNVIVSFEGEVKVIDFGIAKSALRLSESNPKVGFGKYGYMAPEQLVRGGTVDKRTDIYAAGVLLYELITGEKMFQFPDGADYRQMARMVAQGQHPRPSERDKDLADLDEIVLRAVSPEAPKRYANAEELRDALQLAIARRSPTLTPDRLGAYVRELFADEAEEERKFLQQANQLDLAPFEGELRGSRTETVTFALNEDLSRHTGPIDGESRPIVHPTARSARHRWLALGAVTVLALALGALALAKQTRRRHAPPTPVVTPATVAPLPSPVVTPLPTPVLIPASPPAPAPVADKPRPRARPPEKPTAEPVTPAQVETKYKAVAREYGEFKKAHGPRLEAEWNDILEFATYKRTENPQRLDAMLTSFRRRMIEIKSGP
jgi:serine/threonine-protein kinase